MGDVKVDFCVAMFFSRRGNVTSAVGAKVGVNGILESAISTFERDLSTGHGDQQAICFVDDADVMDYEASVKNHCTIRAEPFIGVVAQVDLNFGNFHASPFYPSTIFRLPRFQFYSGQPALTAVQLS